MRARIPGLILLAVIVPAGISLSADTLPVSFNTNDVISGAELYPMYPVSGDFFHDRNCGDALLKLREHNLTEYINSIQR